MSLTIIAQCFAMSGIIVLLYNVLKRVGLKYRMTRIKVQLDLYVKFTTIYFLEVYLPTAFENAAEYANTDDYATFNKLMSTDAGRKFFMDFVFVFDEKKLDEMQQKGVDGCHISSAVTNKISYNTVLRHIQSRPGSKESGMCRQAELLFGRKQNEV